jgi:Transcriptional regulatory protein, C terminal
VTRAGQKVTLTPKELAVLECLLRADGRPVPAEELLRRVWDEAADPFTTTVKTTIDIPPEAVGRLFHPFARLDGRRTHDDNGHGLGLSIAPSAPRTAPRSPRTAPRSPRTPGTVAACPSRSRSPRDWMSRRAPPRRLQPRDTTASEDSDIQRNPSAIP